MWCRRISSLHPADIWRNARVFVRCRIFILTFPELIWCRERTDSGTYWKMIRYYLGEDPILNNAPTYLPFYEQDMKYVLEHFDDLVLKDVAEAGGYGVVFGSSMTRQQKEDFIALLKAEPRRFIAQEVIDFLDIDIMDGGELVPRKADLRAFVLMAEEPMVWKSGLTRFSRNPDSFIVNSSQGGGFKDTWVLSR